MPSVRLTAFFRDDDGHGWSETHDKDGGSSVTSLSTFLANFNSLMVTYRRPLLAGDAYYIGCRASYKTADGTIAGDNIELDPPLQGPQTFSGNALFMGPPEAAVKVRLRNDASTARSDAYLRGVWGTLFNGGVLDFTSITGAEWKRRADLYTGALVTPGGYGWLGTNPALTSRGDVTNYVLNADGTVTFTVAATNGVALPAVGTKLSIKFARINGSSSILNRQLVCIVNSPTSVTSIEILAAYQFLSNGTYIATVKGFIPYAAASYYRRSQRKTGRPFGVGPGRLRAQVLH